MDDIIALSKQSGLGVSLILRAFRGGMEPIVFSFAVFTGMKIAPGFISHQGIRRWERDEGLSPDDVDLMIAELVKDEIEDHLATVFTVVGRNPQNRSGGTGF